MSIEKECKWHFDRSGVSITGPNDSIHETFKANPYYSIMRESIQNSLDAINDECEPVKVTFTIGKLNKNEYPNLFDIKKHIIACWQTHHKDQQAEKLFRPMSSYIDKNDLIEYLKISDNNTNGMDFDANDLNCDFTSFVRAEGKSNKVKGSGGSFGFGKGAYYVLSTIKTLIVSTMTKEGNTFFEGKTRLATHRLDGNSYTRDGFYNQEYKTPVSSPNDIPDLFKRVQPGTDIYIIGLIKLPNRIQEMIKSVLNNFWFSIHNNKLIVQVGNVIINKENLSLIIENYFPNEYERGNAIDIETWNPKPYYKAVRYARSNDQYQVFPGKLETLGVVTLYVYLDKGLPNRTAFFRKPKMVVFKRTSRKINGYAAVFICEDEIGNDLLKEMENPAHNEWKKGNYLNKDGMPHKLAKKSEKEFSDFVNDCLDKLSKSKIGSSAKVMGLEEYLFSTEELLEKFEEQSMEGDSPSITEGTITDEVTTDETGTQTTEIDSPPVKIELTKNKLEKVKEESNVEPNEEGDEEGTGGEGGGGDNPRPIHPGPNNPIKVTPTDEQTESKLFIDVNLRVAAQTEQDRLFHSLIITSPRDVENAEIVLLVGADNDRDDGISLLSTDNGNVDENILTNVKLTTGKNIVKIRFSDNVKHSIKIKAYEIQ